MSKPKDATHTVAGVEGTRKSPRVYTHATVVTYDPVWYAKHKEAGRIECRANRAKSHWDYLAKNLADNERLLADAIKHDAEFAAMCLARNPERAAEIAEWKGIHTESHKRTVESAKEMVLRYGNRDKYIAIEVADERADLAKEYALGVYRYVLSWHMSPTAAAAFANTQARSGQYAAVEVCEVTRK